MATLNSNSCATCGESLGSENPLGRPRRYCDGRCRSRARRRRAAEQIEDPSLQPFAAAIRTAVAKSGLSLRELAARLEVAGYSVSASALSQWGRGYHVPYATDPIRHRLFMLERLALMPTGGLVSALLETRGQVSAVPPVTPRPRAVPVKGGQRTMDEARTLLLERIASLDGSDTRNLVQVAQTEQYVVGRTRLPDRSDMTVSMVALVNGIDRYWHVYAYDPQAPVTVEAGRDCNRRLVLNDIPPVRVSSRTRYQLAATELRFEQPLKRGEEQQFSFSMCYDPGAAKEPTPTPELRRFVTTPATRELRIGILFHADEKPRLLRRVSWRPGATTTEPVEETPVPVDQDGSSEPIIVSYPPPGSYGYQWEWPNDSQFSPE